MSSSDESDEFIYASRDTKGWYNRGYLRHFDSEGPVFITYRLADSLPRDVAEEIRRTPHKSRPAALEAGLDDCAGRCVLERPECARIVEENLHHFDGRRYRLTDWVVMPNHVHVIIDDIAVPLSDVLYSWRSYTSDKIQECLEPHERPENGRLWQRGYFDRNIREGGHLWSTRCYILMNPVKAGLVDSPWDWPFSSAKRLQQEGLDGPIRRWFRRKGRGFYDAPY